ncbi:MAG TPA: hypothetical protein VF756_15110 [Thermoanaerobaculia bacterium]
MKPKSFLIATATALALTASLPAAAQKIQQPRKTQNPTEVISLQARVEGLNGATSGVYGIKPAEAIPIRVGESVRVNLVGTGLVSGKGVEVPVHARFEVAAGRDRIDIAQTGPNWVVVTARGRGDSGLAQLSYDVTSNYEMKGGLQNGRITFEIGEGAVRGDAPIGNNNDSNWRRAQDLTAMLYRGILNVQPSGDLFNRDVQHVHRYGLSGIREVALELAEDYESRYDVRRMSEAEAVELMGDLYRGLLQRNMSDRELWDRDRGFRGNVDTLRRQGLVRLVEVILDSEEFRSVNNLSSFNPSIAVGRDTYTREEWRRERDRLRPPTR